MILLTVSNAEESQKFLKYIMMGLSEPFMAYRAVVEGGKRLVIMFSLANELVLASLREKEECSNSDYYVLTHDLDLKCWHGPLNRNRLADGPVLVVLKEFAMYIESSNPPELIMVGCRDGNCDELIKNVDYLQTSSNNNEREHNISGE